MVYATTVKSEFAEAIAEGRKRVELRTRIPRWLNVTDYIVVCAKGAGGRVRCWIEVGGVLCLPPITMWYRYESVLGIDWHNYWKYVNECDYVYGLVVRCVYTPSEPMDLGMFGLGRAPRWFTLVPIIPNAFLDQLIEGRNRKEVWNAAII